MPKVLFKKPVKELLEKYDARKNDIEKRLEEFSLPEKDEEIYKEMAFCLLTPQSNAKRCWQAVEELEKRGLLFSDDASSIKKVLKSRTRFHNNKSRYIIENKKLFSGNEKLQIKKKLAR